MEKKWYSAETIGDSVITLGKAGEGEAVRIDLDASAWLDDYPNAQMKLYVQPPKPGTPYFAMLSGPESGVISWTIRKSDTQHAGGGVIELMLLDGDDVLIKSRTARTQLLPSPSTGGASEDPPGVNPAWWEEPIKKINEAAVSVIGEANQAINQHAEAVKKNLPQDYTETYDRAIRNERTKAPVIECEATGAIVTVDDAAAMPVMRLVSTIKAYQSAGIPTPEKVKRIRGDKFATAYRTGKNILGGLAFAELIAEKVPGAVLNTEAKTISFTNVQIGSAMLAKSFKENTRYTIILTCDAKKTGASSNIAVYYSNGDYTRLDFPNSATAEKESKVLVTSDKSSVVSLSGFQYGGTTTLLYEECGIFEGAIDKSQFEPYQGRAVKVEFPDAVYGGKMDWQTGVLTVDSEYYEFKGTEDIGTVNAGKGNQYFHRYAGSLRTNKSGVGICSHFENNANLTDNEDPGFTIVNSGSANADRIVFRPKITSVTDAASFKTYLQKQYAEGKPVQVVTKLNEPYTVQLTPKQLDMVKGYNNVWSISGDTDITYPVDTKSYIDKKFAELAAATIGG